MADLTTARARLELSLESAHAIESPYEAAVSGAALAELTGDRDLGRAARDALDRLGVVALPAPPAVARIIA